MVKGIFVSYRRQDSAGHAGRLFDRLAERFGKNKVFMDVEGIEPGFPFVDVIKNELDKSDVFLAVIGHDWLNCKDEDEKRRLDSPDDYIRMEIALALDRGVRVIPVLVEGARLPKKEELPNELRELTARQAIELRDTHWNGDIQILLNTLDTGVTPPQPPVRHDRRALIISGILAVIALVLSVMINPGDQWFFGYFFVGPATVVSLWYVLVSTREKDQRMGVVTLSSTWILLAIMIVAWAYIAGYKRPEVERNFLPYLPLGLAWVVSSFSIIFSRADLDNRVIVFRSWLILGVCFVAARIAWEYVTKPLPRI